MAAFWTWAVRNPALALSALALASGATGVADWSIALAALLVLALIADVASHLARRAAARKARELAALANMGRRDPLIDDYQHRRAA